MLIWLVMSATCFSNSAVVADSVFDVVSPAAWCPADAIALVCKAQSVQCMDSGYRQCPSHFSILLKSLLYIVLQSGLRLGVRTTNLSL